MGKNILLSLFILSIFIILPSCSDPDYNSDYEQGYEKGYSSGYSEGYDEGYYHGEEKAFENFTSCPSEYIELDKYVADYIYDNGILTLEIIKDDISESDYQKLVDVLDDYYTEESLSTNE